MLDWLTWWTGADAVAGFFKPVVAYLASAAAVIFWQLIGKHLLCWLQWYFCWALQTVYSYALAVLTPFLRMVPSFPAMVLDPVLNSYKAANYVFPVNEAMAGMFVIGLVIAIHRLIRWIKQFVPTVAN